MRGHLAGQSCVMDQFLTLLGPVSDLAHEALLRARSLPDFALYTIAVPALLALVSRSLLAIILAAAILWIPAALLLAQPAEDWIWRLMWVASAASVLATAVTYHRRRLAKRARALGVRAVALKQELIDLHTSYEHLIRSTAEGEGS